VNVLESKKLKQYRQRRKIFLELSKKDKKQINNLIKKFKRGKNMNGNDVIEMIENNPDKYDECIIKSATPSQLYDVLIELEQERDVDLIVLLCDKLREDENIEYKAQEMLTSNNNGE